MEQVLKLNAGWMPIEIIDWPQAVDLWIKAKAEIVQVYDRVIHGGFRFKNLPHDLAERYNIGWVPLNKRIQQIYDDKLESWQTAMYMPAVIRCIDFVKPPKNFPVFEPFTRHNVWNRDKGMCQFCGKKISLRQMTYDHVIPQSLGGPTNWKNIVCACQECNNKKRDRTPNEAGMSLIRKPYAPIVAENYTQNISRKMRSMTKRLVSIKEWQDYIYWRVPLIEEECDKEDKSQYAKEIQKTNKFM